MTYSFAKVCWGPSLEVEISQSSIVAALDYVTVNSVTGTVVKFKATLSETDETTLNALVTAHDATPVYTTDPQEVKVLETVPFAKPDYRTKRDATDEWVTVEPSEIVNIDFYLTEERYVTGGEIIFLNAKKGDWLSAEVTDVDSVIPAPYRAALCESHPTVAKYLIKKWLKPGDGSFTIDTYPLNAKITAGLYLRVTYHATADTGDRDVAINYHLTKKL